MPGVTGRYHPSPLWRLLEAGACHGVHRDVQHPLVAQAEVGAGDLLAGRSLQLGPEPAFQVGGCGEDI